MASIVSTTCDNPSFCVCERTQVHVWEAIPHIEGNSISIIGVYVLFYTDSTNGPMSSVFLIASSSFVIIQGGLFWIISIIISKVREDTLVAD